MCDKVEHVELPNYLDIDKAFITTNSFRSRETFLVWHWFITTH